MLKLNPINISEVRRTWELFIPAFFFNYYNIFCSLYLSGEGKEPDFFQVHPWESTENLPWWEYLNVPRMQNHFIESSSDTVFLKENPVTLQLFLHLSAV